MSTTREGAARLMRVLDTTLASKPTQPAQSSKCQAPACRRATKERKPYCTVHILWHDYARAVAEALEEARKEERRVLRRGARAIEPQSTNLREVRSCLYELEEATAERISRTTYLSPRAVLLYLDELHRRGDVYPCGVTRRGAHKWRAVEDHDRRGRSPANVDPAGSGIKAVRRRALRGRRP